MKLIRSILLLTLTVFFICSFGIASSDKKTKLKRDREINIYCNSIDQNNPNCLKFRDLKIKILEIKNVLYQDIMDFCQKKPSDRFCKSNPKANLLTFCTKIAPENENCRSWAELKQADLETRGLLSEEIRKFCLSNPKHPFCD